MFTPYLAIESPTNLTDCDAYLPVRVAEAPRSDGSMLVYLPDGTAFVVNSRDLVCLDSEDSGPDMAPRRAGRDTAVNPMIAPTQTNQF
jgi:hypothetical protein